jgi:hypothetical protein
VDEMPSRGTSLWVVAIEGARQCVGGLDSGDGDGGYFQAIIRSTVLHSRDQRVEDDCGWWRIQWQSSPDLSEYEVSQLCRVCAVMIVTEDENDDLQQEQQPER